MNSVLPGITRQGEEKIRRVPANTRARLYLPRWGMAHDAVEVNGAPRKGRFDGPFVVIDDIGSGTHRFVRQTVP